MGFVVWGVFLVCLPFLSCGGRGRIKEEGLDAGSAVFHILGDDGEWTVAASLEIDGGTLRGDVPDVVEVRLGSDAAGTGFKAGDTLSFVSWNSERDGSGEAFDEATPAAGDWWAQYEVVAEATFYILSANGLWVEAGSAEIVGGAVAAGESVPVLPVGELSLEADADGNGMLRGDTVKAVGWNSKRDGSGEAFDSGNPKGGGWYARYEVVECTVWFSANFGEGNDPAPVSADESSSWKVAAPDTSGMRKHFRATWHEDEALSEPFDFANDTVSHSMTLYADWETPLCFTALVDGCSVELKKQGSPDAVSLETSVDGGETWQAYVVGTTGSIALANGKSVYFSATDLNAGFTKDSNINYYKFDFGYDESKKIAASGNIMSLLDGTLALKDLSGKVCAFSWLFSLCRPLVSAPVLPAETLAGVCYSHMFSGCTSLTSAPELPATELAASCYYGMFSECTSLTSAPALPAETLGRQLLQLHVLRLHVPDVRPCPSRHDSHLYVL